MSPRLPCRGVEAVLGTERGLTTVSVVERPHGDQFARGTPTTVALIERTVYATLRVPPPVERDAAEPPASTPRRRSTLAFTNRTTALRGITTRWPM